MVVKQRGRKRIIHESNHVVHSKEKAGKRLITEGAVSEAAAGLSSYFITPFALAIGATSLHVGLLSSFTELVSPLGQVFSSNLMERHSRKKILISFALLQALLWIPIIMLSYFYWAGKGVEYLPYLLIFFYALFSFFMGVRSPPLFSWIGDLVPEDMRGKYFGKRNRIIGIVGNLVFIAASFFLDYTKTHGFVLVGFSLLFSISLVLRLLSPHLMKHIFCPHFHLNKGDHFTFIQFLKRYDNFGKFAVYQAVFNFSIMLASPFFAVYMLEDLQFSYTVFTIVSLSSTFFHLLLIPFFGRLSDRYGNLRLLYIAGFTFPLTPLLWVFIKDPLMLILLPGLISGIGNAAFSIGVTNYTYDSVRPEKRGLCVAYVGILNGIGIFIGSIAGGLMIQYLNLSFMNPILFVFIVAFACRLLTSLIFLPQLKEVRRVRGLKGLSVDVYHPFRMVRHDIVWFKKNFKA